MNKKSFSPFIRIAMHSRILAPFCVNERVLFDYEIILVRGGMCKFTIDEQVHILEKNDIVFIRPGVPHKFESIENTNFIQPHIHFDVCYTKESEERTISYQTRKTMSEYELSLIHEDVFKDVAIPNVFRFQDMTEFKSVFFDIIDLFQSKSDNYELAYKAKMLHLLQLILTQFDKKVPVESVNSDSVIFAVKNYIDNNFQSIITLDFLCHQFYINKFTLMRKFKILFKENIMSYYRNKRLDYAKDALSRTTLSVSNISEALNFNDLYSFSRFFKSAVGLTPTEYRIQCSQETD